MLTDSYNLEDSDYQESEYEVAHTYQQEILVSDLLSYPAQGL